MIDTRKAFGTLVLLAIFTSSLRQQPLQAQAPQFLDLPVRASYLPGLPSRCTALVWQNLFEWDSLWQEQYTYHLNGWLAGTRHDDFGGFTFLPTTAYTLTYDSQGRTTSETVQRWTSGTYINENLEQWFYDSDGRDSLYHQFQWTNTPFGWAWDTILGSRWAYTQAAGWDQADQYGWASGPSGGAWTLQARTSSHLNALQEHDTIVYSAAFFGALAPLYRYIDIVWDDFAARRPLRYREQNYGIPWRDSKLWSFDYNGTDRTIYTQDYLGNDWDSTRIETYTYDADTLLLLHELQHPGGLDSAWTILSGERYTHTKDSLGHLLETHMEEFNQLVGYNNAMRYLYADFFTARPEPVASLDGIDLYPNPASSVVNIRLGAATPGPLLFQVFDMHGRLRLASKAAITQQPMSYQVPAGMEAGMYRYLLSTPAGTATGNLMIAR